MVQITPLIAILISCTIPPIFCDDKPAGGVDLKSLGIRYFLKTLRTTAENIVEKSGGNTKCARDLQALIQGVINKNMWALQMMDANGKIHPGVLAGNLYQFGHFDQCLNIETEAESGEFIRGQYCSIILVPRENFTSSFGHFLDTGLLTDELGIQKSHQVSDILTHIKFVVGSCIPASCSIENLQSIADYTEATWGSSVHAVFTDNLCSHKERKTLPYNADIYIFTFFAIVGTVVILSTLYDLLFCPQSKGSPGVVTEVFTAFSIPSNLRKIAATDFDECTLTCINGIKVISMFWIMIGHRYGLNIFSANTNGLYVFEWKTNWQNSLVIASPLAVDTYLSISGILLSYAKQKYSEKYRMNLLAYYLRRVFRIVPALFAMVLFYIGVVKYLGDGPAWGVVMQKMTGSCYHTWWATVLFLTNWVNVNLHCMEQSWYLSVDTQLYLVAPLILFNFNKHPVKVAVISLVIGSSSMIYTYVITVQNNYGALFLEMSADYFTYVYFSTFSRLPAWLIGIFSGYIIYRCRHHNQKEAQGLSFYWRSLLWLLSFAIMIGLLYFHHVLSKETYDVYRCALYNSIVRPFWSFAVCSVIYLCATDSKGKVNKFLSAKVFIVLGRLTYSMYLTHLAVIMVQVAQQKEASYFGNFKTCLDFCGDLSLTILTSLTLCLTFESPGLALQKILARASLPNYELVKSSEDTKDQPDVTNSRTTIFWVFSFNNSNVNVKNKIA